jgi:hypothetical protein
MTEGGADTTVWIYDNREQRYVEARLETLSDAHIDQANRTWVPEFHRRRQLRVSDQDFLVWDWPSKEKYLLAKNTIRDYVVSRDDRLEGIIILQEPEPSRLEPFAKVLYVRYVATAPWNRPCGSTSGQHRFVGTVLLNQGIRESVMLECEGRLGLHSLSNSDTYYRKLGFRELGPDPGNRGLTYFELPKGTVLDSKVAR